MHIQVTAYDDKDGDSVADSNEAEGDGSHEGRQAAELHQCAELTARRARLHAGRS